MKLSRTVAYAVRASVFLAAELRPEPVSCRRLAESEGLPERFLLQILRSLVTHGILRSTRGVEGGYSLNRTPREITLLNLIEAIEGPLQLEMPAPGQGNATLQLALQQVTERVRADLASVSLEQMVKRNGA